MAEVNISYTLSFWSLRSWLCMKIW